MKYLFNIILTACMFFVACKKELKVSSPTVSIDLKNARSSIDDTFVFKLGDTCKFALSGYADNIIFWGGGVGNKYELRNRSLKLGKTTLSFTTTSSFGTQTGTLQVLATNKLKGLDSVSVVNTNWTDITNRAALATSATAVNSGIVDLSDIISNERDSLFIAFKYTGVTGSTQRTWVVSNYLVNNVLADYTYNLASLANDNLFWTRYGNVWTPASARWVATTTGLTIIGGPATQASNTSWVVSKPIYAGRVVPDVPTATVKNISAAATTAYTYKYAATGEYKATFISYNTTPDGAESSIKEFKIKIIP
jgi:hypothetical protein